jgi:hydrogenase nickel incorporation protein HypA/HybF
MVMHELSVATQLVEIASEHLVAFTAPQVLSLKVRLGRLTCLDPETLRSAFLIAAEGTVVAGARLELVSVPLGVHCPVCRCEKQLAGVQSLRCPDCGTLCGELRQGRELELESIEIAEPTATPNPRPIPRD